MKILIAEDEFINRKLIHKLLSAYGDVDVTTDGEEAIEAFTMALDEEDPYDLLCLDIMMPKKDGLTALKEIRQIEADRDISIGKDSVKIMMTTALGDSKSVLGAFRDGCESYVVKPLIKEKIFSELLKLGLIQSSD
ncbi:MAG: response regulator [Candidatus Cloacimonadota bacterium]|nr:MAG: response regulator [Candidatus Cloacimonadota bacterium]